MPRFISKLLATLVSAGLTATLAVPTVTAGEVFSDIAHSYAREAITALHAQGKLDGMGDGIFAPHATMTREQYAKLLVSAMEKEADTTESQFADNAEPEAWYYGYVNAASANGFMIGVDGETFGVGQPINREQAVITIVRAAGLEAEVQPDATPSFTDAAEISSWARGYVAVAEAHHLVVGMGDGSFRGDLEMTREMAVQMLYRALQNDTEPSPEEAAIRDRADQVLTALEQADLAQLASLVHPTKGVRFSPYAYVMADVHQVFTPGELTTLDPAQVYAWGFYDGSGNPMEMTFADYIHSRFAYGMDYKNAPAVGFDQVVMSGNTIINLDEAYPDGRFIEFHFPGTPEYSGMDWSSLRLVFEELDGQWYLVGVIGDQWTI